MRHRASRLHAVVAALLLALGALCTAAGVASLTSSASDSSAVSSRAHDGGDRRPEAFAPRATAVSPAKSGAHGSGLHLDLLAAFAAVGVGALLLLGWFTVGRARSLLPRLVTAPVGARAPPHSSDPTSTVKPRVRARPTTSEERRRDPRSPNATRV